MPCCEHCQHASEDHDLLIRISERLDSVLKDRDDHERRIRRAEKFGFIGLGVLYAYEFMKGLSK